MSKPITAGAVLALSALCTPAAGATEFSVEGGARLVVAVGLADSESPAPPEGVAARLDGWAEGEALFASGLSLGVGAAIGAEADHPLRQPRGGVVGDCPQGVADCAFVRGPISGFAGAGSDGDDRLRATVEAAYIFLRGGYGEASLGRDVGAAARFSLSAPSILEAVGYADGAVSLSGLGGVITRNDASANATKVAFASPRILGLRAGVSFAPDGDSQSLDAGFEDRAGAAPSAPLEDILEAGLSFSRTWRSGVQTQAAVTYLHADAAGPAGFGPLQSWHAGLVVGAGPWRFGGAHLWSNNAWREDRPYRGFTLSAVYEPGPWALMLEAAAAQDDLIHVDVRGFTGAVRRSLGADASIAAGVRWEEQDAPTVRAGVRGEEGREALGVFLEIAAHL